MEYSVFKKEFKSYVLANDEWNIKEENYFLYEDGFTSEDEEELEFIPEEDIKDDVDRLTSEDDDEYEDEEEEEDEEQEL